MSGHAHLHLYSMNFITKAIFLDMFDMTIIILSFCGKFKCCINNSSSWSQHDYGSSHFPAVTIHAWFTELDNFMAHWPLIFTKNRSYFNAHITLLSFLIWYPCKLDPSLHYHNLLLWMILTRCQEQLVG